jgi:GDPmannose 4,6-dehydratase
MFGRVRKTPQNEETPFHPRSSYGISKVAGFELTRNYRESYNMFACSGILFNHESPRRGFEFVTRKITSHAAMIKLGLTDRIPLGNIEAKRDWGHAQEYVKVMWRMLQNDTPEDYVVATGKCHSVKEFLEMAFSCLELDYHRYLEIDQALIRPAEVTLLQGDSSKAQRELGWSYDFSLHDLIEEMVENDLKILRNKL